MVGFNWERFPEVVNIQIRKYTELQNLQDLQGQFATISALTKKVRDELYRLLVEEGRYFG